MESLSIIQPERRVTRAQIVAEARSWISTSFQHQASLKGVATDCIGLLVGVMAALGMPQADAIKADPRFKGYGPQPDGKALKTACGEYATEIALDDVLPGDVLLFAYLGDPMHVAWVSGVFDRVYVIHGYSTVGRVVENSLDARWRRRVVAAYRLPGVD